MTCTRRSQKLWPKLGQNWTKWVNVGLTQCWVNFTHGQKSTGSPIKPKKIGCFDPVSVLMLFFFVIVLFCYLPKLQYGYFWPSIRHNELKFYLTTVINLLLVLQNNDTYHTRNCKGNTFFINNLQQKKVTCKLKKARVDYNRSQPCHI